MTEPQTIAIVILLAALAAFAVAYWIVGPGRRRGPRPAGDIPLAMRPYHSDEELETTGMERAMAWGVALTLFSAVFLPLYWFVEPSRIADRQAEFYEEDVHAGRLLYGEACAACHGADLRGGSAPHPDPEIDAAWPAPALHNIDARYADNPHVANIELFVAQTVKQGRPGTPMPAWGAFYDGPFNDQEVDRIVRYILAVQEDDVPEAQAFVGASGADLFQDNCARCHGQQAQGSDIAPSLVDVFARYGGVDDPDAEAVVRTTIQHGRVVPGFPDMPAWAQKLTEDAIDRIVDFLKSIQR